MTCAKAAFQVTPEEFISKMDFMMNTTMRIPFKLAVSLLFIACSATAQADLQEGITAYRKGNYQAALKEIRPLAENGDAKAQALLGEIYDSGKGVPLSHTEAASWYRKAAEQGDATAQTALGVMYENGVGVPQDNKEAVSWYQKAAEQGSPEAQYILGGLYKRGQGLLPADLVQAHKWFNLAAATGFEIANEDREEVEALMNKEQIEKAKLMAKEWLEKHK